uniref:Radical SAM core domain-containing protein n=1 Tax=Pyrodinium bahamense TaxID=73915 RepID=A0A7S0A363_9DINO
MSVRRARRDQHARRKNIPCGMPLLTGHSCDYACRYCYIQDWYAFVPPTPGELSGQEVLLSLLYNPHWVPSRDFIILGDVCDPFHPNLLARSMEYIKAVALLGSPVQFSTKSEISDEVAAELGRISNEGGCPLSALVSVSTIKHVHILEPTTPSFQSRVLTIRRLSGNGLSVFLFMRPLIPGASDDFPDILLAAKEAGAVGVVVGSLRVSRKIYRRLKQAKVVDIEAIDSQLQGKGIAPEDLNESQVDIQDEPLRTAVVTKAAEVGLVTVRRACCANAWSSQRPCRKPKCLMRDSTNW